VSTVAFGVLHEDREERTTKISRMDIDDMPVMYLFIYLLILN